VNVRWGLAALPEVVAGRRAFLFATERWTSPLDVAGRWSALPTDEELDVRESEVLVALGGGSTIDTAKRVSAASGLPLVSVPTTYSGAEWTPYFGVRGPDRKMRGGGGGARLYAIVYDVELTLALPRDVTGGTALNALAHCCEALYVVGRDPDADALALAGAATIDDALPRVLDNLADRSAREQLLRGAACAGEALARSGLALAHAMAQVVGGRYGLPHGTLNAICLPPVLRFNAAFLPEALLGGRAAARAAELKERAGFGGLRALGVPGEDLDELAGAIAERPGARANPHPASVEDIRALLRSAF
jgi:maleylacetate reductase